MTLTVDPPACALPASGGKSSHTLTNPTSDRYAFKIKSSNNTEYRVKPVYGFVEANSSTTFEITRTSGAVKEDKLVVHIAVCDFEAVDATAAFNAAAPSGSITLLLTVT